MFSDFTAVGVGLNVSVLKHDESLYLYFVFHMETFSNRSIAFEATLEYSNLPMDMLHYTDTDSDQIVS